MTYEYYRMNTKPFWAFLGTDSEIQEYKNDCKDGRCPFCHRQVRSLFYQHCDVFTDEDGNEWEDKPIGCFQCIAECEVEDEEDLEQQILQAEYERELRRECRGTAYEY